MNAGIHRWLQLIRPDLKLFLWISLGVFLFILFFQPFPLATLDFNNRLLFVAGLGAILFVLMVISRSLFQHNESHTAQQEAYRVVPNLFSNLILLIAASVAYAFYLRYVGRIEITFFIMFRVVFICLIPPVAIGLCDTFRDLRKTNNRLKQLTDEAISGTSTVKTTIHDNPITFTSENSTENLTLNPADVAFIKSADNYVEVAYTEGTKIKKQLLRNTLKKIEEQLHPYSDFIRCHRMCIVNTGYIISLENKQQSYWLTIRGYDEQIPVSRQYLLKVRERL